MEAKKKKGQSPSYSVKLGIEQNEKWVIELNFVLVTLKYRKFGMGKAF